METADKTQIVVEALIQAPVEKVWRLWTEPEHIKGWCSASDDWHVPYAENELRKDGRFKTGMAARDGSMSFDFTGFYTNVDHHRLIEYTMDDGRKVNIVFSGSGNETRVTETFEPESMNSHEMQKGGWQAILDNFKRYTEKN